MYICEKIYKIVFFHYLLCSCAILLSLLPLKVLYGISHLLSFLLNHVIRYRKKVILSNLKKSFPTSSESEIHQIANAYYRHLSCLAVEMIKMLTMSKANVVHRYRIVNPEILTPYYQQNKSVILASAHYNNWEWMILSMCLQLKHDCVGVG